MDNLRKLLVVGVTIGLFAALALPPRTQASSVVYESIPDLAVAPSNQGLGIGFCSACTISAHPDAQVVDFFTLINTYSVDQVNFVTSSFTNTTFWAGLSGLTVKIWSGDLSNVLFSQDVIPTQVDKLTWTGNFGQVTSVDTFILAATLSGLVLSPGDYGISFFAANLAVPTFLGGNGLAFQLGVGGGPLNESVGFQLVGSEVPLPATLPLFASGLAGLGWLARRRKRSQAAAA